LHSLLYLETALHISGGTTTHHQECKELYLQHLAFVTPLLVTAAMPPPIIRSAISVSTASGICHTVTANCHYTTTHYQERNKCIYSIWYLSHRYCQLPLYHHPLSGAQTSVSTASGICHTLTANCRYTTTHHQERKQVYLQHLVFVTPLLLTAAIPPSIIRSANKCIFSIWYLSHRYCHLPLYHHPSSGAQTSVSTASGICHTVTTTCHYTTTHHQERKQLYLHHLVFVTLLLLPVDRSQ